MPTWSKGDSLRRPPGPRQIEPGLLSRWNRTCREQHRICRSKPGLRPVSIPFRLVDVALDRVVPAPALCEYVALSYVWGDISPYTLRKSEIRYDPPQDRDFNRSYTTLDRNTLPRTIRDAMFVVACIGERYLWVDSLCIVQDDAGDLSQNLRQMHRIYSGASLTIVAAGADNANAGLPGIYAGSREISPIGITIDTVSLVPMEPCLPTEGTPWHRRAWTYQEYHFSDQCMIFANDRVYFECPSGQRSEHMPDYLDQFTQKISRRTKKMSAVETYEAHVCHYTQRHLTLEADIFNGFTAIMNEHEEKHGTEFCWGLPHDEFFRALLWTIEGLNPGDNVRRRQSQPGGTCFPSWSWAGWVGALWFHRQWKDVKHRSAVVWPWERNYDVDDVFDYAKSGILTVRGKLATIDPKSSYVFQALESGFFHEDVVLSQIGKLTGLLLGDFLDCPSSQPDTEALTLAVLIVEQYNNGVYARKGLVYLEKAEWDALEIVEEIVHLG